MSPEYEAAIEIRDALLQLRDGLAETLDALHNDVGAFSGFLSATLDRGLDPRPRVAAEILAAVLRQAGVDLVSEALENPQRAQVLFSRVWRLTDSFLAFGAGMNAAGVWTGPLPTTAEALEQMETWITEHDRLAESEAWNDGEQRPPLDPEE